MPKVHYITTYKALHPREAEILNSGLRLLYERFSQVQRPRTELSSIDFMLILGEYSTVLFSAWEFDHPNHPLALQPFVSFDQFDEIRGGKPHCLLKPVAMVLLVQIQKPGLSIGQIEDLIVHPEYVNRGVGQELLQLLVLFAKYRRRLDRLQSSAECREALRFVFTQAGFTQSQEPTLVLPLTATKTLP